MRYSALLVLLAASSLTGCAQTATMHVWKPAEVEVGGIERLAVLDFRGLHQSGQIARSALVSQFWERDFYKLVDQSELMGAIPSEGGDLAGPPEVHVALNAARQIGVDAILVGDVVSYQASDDVTTDQRFGFFNSDERDGGKSSANLMGFGYENNETVNREVSVSLAFQLIECESGEVLAAQQSSYTETGQMRNGEGYLPARERALTECMHRCARDVVNMITPHEVPLEAKLAGGGFFGKAGGQIRRGNAYASKGEWQTAEQHWRAALQLAPDNHAALYNLGLAYQARSDYVRAEEFFNQALAGKRSSDYSLALARLKINRDDYRVAMSQKNHRSLDDVPDRPFDDMPSLIYAGTGVRSDGESDARLKAPYPPSDGALPTQHTEELRIGDLRGSLPGKDAREASSGFPFSDPGERSN